MICFVTDTLSNEPDILASVRMLPLSIKGLEGELLRSISAPPGGWTHELLCEAGQDLVEGAEAFLGVKWVGSTEV